MPQGWLDRAVTGGSERQARGSRDDAAERLMPVCRRDVIFLLMCFNGEWSSY